MKVIDGVYYSIDPQEASLVFEVKWMPYGPAHYEERLYRQKKAGRQFFIYGSGGPDSPYGQNGKVGWDIKPVAFDVAVLWAVRNGIQLDSLAKAFKEASV